MRDDQLAALIGQLYSRATSAELGSAMFAGAIEVNARPSHNAFAPLQRLVDRCLVPR